ncbi:WAT1-related protein At4g15540-like [Mangifera indica]|uniref:WAT1-related protein At4g15540-like n=1 Tax=Mangifera indica TaxID=29780 RepID=UPI001CFAA76C|nr:WAT1-related protein At4g15540-like [Mangifera indica]
MELCNSRVLIPSLGMVTVILTQVSDMEVIKAAMSKGLNKYVIIVYVNALCTILFLLCSLLIYSTSERPPLNSSILCKLFLLSVIGISAQIFGFVGLQYSSPTLGTAMLNLTPAFTFILAITFRIEKVNWRSKSSQAKSLGAVVSIAGAFVVTLYRGPPIIIKTVSGSFSPLQSLSPQSSWILGGIFLAAEAFLHSAWYNLQASILKKFPSVLIIMFYHFFFRTILSMAYSLIVVTDLTAWKLRPDMAALAILYSAVVGTGFRLGLMTWCLSRTGPLYVSMFKPLGILFSVVMDIVFLGDPLRLGSLIGALIIVTGFYAVMWGKLKEENTIEGYEIENFKASHEKVPLICNHGCTQESDTGV